MKNLLGRIGGPLLALLALVVVSPSATLAQDPPSEEVDLPTSEPRATEVVPGQIIVKFRPSTGAANQAQVQREEGLEREKSLPSINAVVYDVEGQSVARAIRDLERRPDVAYAEPDYRLFTTGYTDEPLYDELWGLNNTGQTVEGSAGTEDVDVNAKEASAVTQGDPDLVVAVIDSGVDLSHPDLADRKWTNPGESGDGKESNGVDDDGNGYVDDVNGWDFANNDNTVYDPADGDEHGTHVAGTIAASVNDQGVVGVAPNVQVMPLKFIGPFGGATSDAIEAIDYAKDAGVKLSNNSWGGGPFSQALTDAIGNSGQLFVASAGNGGPDKIGDDNDVTPSYPASYDNPNILSVAAVDNGGDLATFSNFGDESVDISAPGVDVLSSVPTNDWDYFSGTSMAAPHATGAAALAGSENPGLLDDPTALKKLLLDSGKPLPATDGQTLTGDLVDANAAANGAGG